MRAILLILFASILSAQAQVMLPARKAISKPQANGWTPQQIQGLRYWWVASDLSAGPVSGNWVDRIQGAYLQQPNSNYQPVADPTTLKAVRFEAGQYLTNSNPTSFNPLIDYGPGIGYSGAMFVIFQPVLPYGTPTEYGLVLGERGFSERGLYTRSSGTLTDDSDVSQISYGTVTNFQYINTVINVTNSYSTNGALTAYINGAVSFSTNSGGQLWATENAVGLNTNTWNRYYEGWIYEIGFASNRLSTNDIANLHNYGTNIYNVSAINTSLTNTAVFDGSNDYMRLYPATPPGLANGKTFTFSCWVNFLGGDGTGQVLLIFADNEGGNNRFFVLRNTSNLLQLTGRNSSATTILSLTSTSTLKATNGWTHVYACIDLTDTAKRKIYFNGVPETLIVTTYSNDTIDFVNSNYCYTIGGDSLASPGQRLNAAVAEFWWNDSYLDDTSKFISGGHPISLGANGETPIGSSPVLYFHYPGNLFRINVGTGRSYGLVGSLGQTTPP